MTSTVQPTSLRAPPIPQHARVLIVDEDRHVREALAHGLRLKGHDVHTAPDGPAGLAALTTARFDVAIVELRLPDITGIALLAAFKQASPATDVIFATPLAPADAAAPTTGAAFAYLGKPLEVDVLLDSVGKVLERQKLARAYRLVTEHILDAVFLLDLEGCFVFGNRRLEELTGYRIDELLGRPSSIVLTPDSARQRAARMKAVRQGEAVPPVVETEVLRKDGTRLWVEINTTSVIEDGHLVARIGAARDITARRENERKRIAEAAVGVALAEAATVPAAAVAVMHAIGEALGWDLGAVWMVHAESGVLRCLDTWHAEGSPRSPALEGATRRLAFERGTGLLGRVWSEAAPLWVADVATQGNLPRSAAAAADDFHTFLGFPLGLGQDVIGVVEFISRDIRPANPAMLHLVTSVGLQFAQFSARKHAEDELRRTNAMLEALIQSSPVTMISLDLEGRVIRWNRSAERLFGWTEAELTGREPPLVPEEQAEETSRSLALWRQGVVTTDVEVVRRSRDGSLIPMSRSGGPLRDGRGEIIGTIANLVDIRDRKRSEAALQESEERFRAMFEQAAVGLSEATTGGRWLRVNQRLCDIVGYTREELLERTFTDITHPDDLDADRAGRDQLLAGQVTTLFREKRFIHKDGSTVWAQVTVSLVRDPAGAPWYFIGAVQDITERRRLEQEFHHAQRMEGVGQLAGGIAHDFNNLLTIINGRCALILASLPPADPVQRHVDLIEKTVVRATGLTRQLLAFSRKQVLQPKVVAINGLVSHAMDLLARLIGEDIDLAFVPGADAGRVHVDPGQIEQVIVNLVVNSRDAMPDGGRLTIETANTVLDAGYAARHVDVTPGRYVMLNVSDTGTGMSAEVQARIFEPFFTTKEIGKGTGLGLATVYGIVRQSGGHVRVYSEPGTGTTFKIYLPRTDAATQDESTPAVGAAPRGTETILLVEDEAEVRSLARELLESLGYVVLPAGSPPEAIAIAGRHEGRIDLLLTDVIMPTMNGRALAAAIGASRPETAIMFISGYAGDAIVRHGVLEPGMHFLEKPFTPHALALKVRAALDTPDEP